MFMVAYTLLVAIVSFPFWGLMFKIPYLHSLRQTYTVIVKTIKISAVANVQSITPLAPTSGGCLGRIGGWHDNDNNKRGF